MAYRRRRASRSRTSRASYSARGRSYAGRRTRRAPARRRRVSRSGGGRTVRIVVQTVGASPVTGQSSVVPLRAMF